MTGDLLTLSTREMDTLAIITRLAERRMTQAEAAREVGVAPNTWARWERDLHPPKAGLHRKAVERWIQKENR